LKGRPVTPHDIGRAGLGLFVTLSVAVAFDFLAGLEVKDIAILGIVGGGVFYATMRMIDRPPT
jgi:hypothetical protein